MEKRKPHYPLTIVKVCLAAGDVRSTRTALEGAAALGLCFGDVLHVVGNLAGRDFYKSMTAYQDCHAWQDVYRVTVPAGAVYIKLTVIDGLLIVSFKEL